MNLNVLLGRETVQAMVDIEIEKTQESFHAYAVPANFVAHEGDEVWLHGVPTDIAFGTQMVMQCRATVHRANALGRAWTRFTSLFELTELYEVGFQPKDAIDNGFVTRSAA